MVLLWSAFHPKTLFEGSAILSARTLTGSVCLCVLLFACIPRVVAVVLVQQAVTQHEPKPLRWKP
jgi:hypothetical protein